jgi:hypothetical protein
MVPKAAKLNVTVLKAMHGVNAKSVKVDCFGVTYP